MSVTITVGKRITLDDVVNVSVHRQILIIGLSADPIGAEVSSPIARKELPPIGLREISRASLTTRVISLALGRLSSNLKTISFMVTALNEDIVPVLSSPDSAGQELIDFIEGKGKCFSKSGNVVDTVVALAEAKLSGIELAAGESEELSGYPLITTGVGCLLAAGAKNLLSTVDCISALSCEAFGCSTDAFDALNFEMSRPHRGQMASATNLRLLLEGSKRVNTCPSEKRADAIPLHCAPQTTGPCRDVILAATKSMEIELNSFESTATSGNKGQVVDASQALLLTSNLTACLRSLSAASGARLNAVQGILGSPLMPTIDSDLGGVDGVPAAMDALTGLGAQLGTELYSSLKAVSDVEAAAEATANLARLEMAEKKAKAEASGNGNGGVGKPEAADDSHLTPEQRAKAEAKRKQKAEKAAQKAAAKEQKKAAGSSVVLGAGCATIRKYVTQQCSAGSNTCASSTAIDSAAEATSRVPLSKDAVLGLLYPFSRSMENNSSTGSGGGGGAGGSGGAGSNEEPLSFFQVCTKTVEDLSSGGKYRPKIAKGARDFGPEQMRIREQAFTAIRKVFKRHGGVEIDTPVFELKELLTGKYGEDSKLIYDLADQGGELLSLRYDLTVPFARFLAMNSVGNIKRFHIAKVYRRDQPQPARGRYREFYQCDFDVAGSFSPMVADAEVITVATEILTDLPVGAFCIKLNHRKLLDAIFDICGVPAEKFRPICSAVDKLDKMPWEEVKKEMVEEKGLAPECADRISTFVLHSGEPKTLWKTLREQEKFGEHAAANEAMRDLELLFNYLEAMGSLQYVSFDLSLARGLDYYTGVIYEAILTAGTVSVGSIAAGGRYDNLVGMFSPAGIQTPCVGVSIGIERVFAIMEKKAEALNLLQSGGIQVYIASIGANLIAERMKVAQLLWQANLAAEYPHQDNPKFKKQLDEVLERQIPFMVVFGEDELAKGVVKVKDMRQHTEVEVNRADLVDTLLSSGCIASGAAGADTQFLEMLKNADTA